MHVGFNFDLRESASRAQLPILSKLETPDQPQGLSLCICPKQYEEHVSDGFARV